MLGFVFIGAIMGIISKKIIRAIFFFLKKKLEFIG